MADFLFEIGLEEVPARMIAGAEAELLRRTVALLEREQLLRTPTMLVEEVDTGEYRHLSAADEWVTTARSYSTPRRLAVLVRGVKAQQADVTEELVGPAVKIAFKEGKPGPAAEAFAKKCGVSVDALKTVETAKG